MSAGYLPLFYTSNFVNCCLSPDQLRVAPAWGFNVSTAHHTHPLDIHHSKASQFSSTSHVALLASTPVPAFACHPPVGVFLPVGARWGKQSLGHEASVALVLFYLFVGGVGGGGRIRAFSLQKQVVEVASYHLKLNHPAHACRSAATRSGWSLAGRIFSGG